MYKDTITGVKEYYTQKTTLKSKNIEFVPIISGKYSPGMNHSRNSSISNRNI